MLGRSVGREAGNRVEHWFAGSVLATLIIVSVASLPAGAQDEPEDWARLPVIGQGDQWVYELTGRQKGEVVNTVAAEETVRNELGYEAQSLRIESRGTVTSDQTGGRFLLDSFQSIGETTHEIEADKWVRVDDHATLQVEGTTTVQEAGVNVATLEVLEAFDPPLVQNFYPFTTGFEWVSWADFYLERDGESPQEGTATRTLRVTGQETVSGSAGTFDTWRLEVTTKYEGSGQDRFSTNIVQWWSQEACGLVKEERYDTDGELITRMALTEFSCSGVYRDEPSYSGRQVSLREAHTPPWLSQELEADEAPQDSDPATGVLPSGPVVWGALSGLAGASLLFLALGRTRLMR